MPDAIAPCLSVVMPCYNEVATVKDVVERVLASPFTAEVLVVDDGSTDGTADVLAGIDDARVRVVHHQLNLGKGSALRRAFPEVTADFVIVQDADLEYDPAEYGAVLGPLLSGQADVVFGSRFHGKPHRVLYFWHAVASKTLTLASNACTNLNLTDMGTGCKAFRREVVQSMDLEQDRFGIEPELTAKVAEGGWRVYEVGIPYEGRTYDDGKKVRAIDGVRTLACILRYSKLGRAVAKPREMLSADGLADFDEADDELSDTLDSLDDAVNYADWIIELVAPHLGGEIVEIGAGHGTMSDRLRRLGRLTVSEPSARACELLADRFAAVEDVRVVQADASGVMALGADGHGAPFDAAVMINVLEHIGDHVGVLADIRRGLRPGGTIAVYVPAHEVLYSDFDRRIGHQRRYRRSTLAQALSLAGFELVDLRYVNLPGWFAWVLVARLLRQQPTRSLTTRIYDRFVVPVLRRTEGRRPAPFGQSLLAVARRPLDDPD
jgi:SAM-dependent methyltransferase